LTAAACKLQALVSGTDAELDPAKRFEGCP
jgi:hypothetical protein